MSRDAIFKEAGELALGRPYPERSEREPGWHDRTAEFLIERALKPVRNRIRSPASSLKRILQFVEPHDRLLRTVSDADLQARGESLRRRLRREGFRDRLVGEAFALVREAASRTMGKRHFDTQLMAGWALLQGRLIEMATGEGKTMAATLPVATVALAGYPTHVITVNDYLAKRDAEEMEPLYKFLGLSVGSVIQGMKKFDRREAYSRSITYCSNKELAFDYLRDRVTMTNRGSKLHLSLKNLHGSAKKNDDLVLRGLFYGIVDEADSVFIDEARTPLILSSAVEEADEKQQCEQALQIARGLDPAHDYTVNRADRNVTLTENGRDALGTAAGNLDGIWSSVRTREELLAQALTALHLYHRDQHYVVAEGKVQIVDESTGRVMPDRSWERGLHQLIEVKEGCEPTQRRETLARITYQRLFCRYIRLAGMTGTAREVAREIRSIYGLDVVRIPLHRPLQRQDGGRRVFLTGSEKWRHVADTVERLAMAEKRPVLIGTRSVKASEELSKMLRERCIEHALLNAKQDQTEADIVRLAGLPSRVTVATNMAGRGTDIRLGEGAARDGGLHVILTEFHESARIDRQLFGRCGRQGDPGSYEAIVSLEDELYAIYAASALRWVSTVARRTGSLPVIVCEALRIVAQFRAGRRSAQVRMQNLALDRKLDRVMAFAGNSE